MNSLTFWWEAAQGSFDAYELVFDRKGGDFSAPAAAFRTEDNRTTELTLSYQEAKSVYDATQQDGTASLVWSVKTSPETKAPQARPGAR